MADDEVLRLAIVGAGPHALSLLCRLIEDEPDLLDEGTRAKMAAKAGSKARPHTRVRKLLAGKRGGAAERLRGVRVIDMHGRWLAQWESDFAALEIAHCRSHADLHPCPCDFQSLRVWAEMHKRSAEMWHMQYIDREACRRQGYAGPYVLPGSTLFIDFCRAMVDRYRLGSVVRQGTVESIVAVEADGTTTTAAAAEPAGESDASAVPAASGRVFSLTLADGSTLRARRVVCAMGPGPAFAGMRAHLPWWCDELRASVADAGRRAHVLSARLSHSSQLTHMLGASGSLKHGLGGRSVLIVGGGQTAGHLSLLGLNHGCAKVSLVARRRIVRKPFDVGLELVMISPPN